MAEKLNAEERLEKIRGHLEKAYGHDKFAINEKQNQSNEVLISIDKYFSDEEYMKKIVFKNGSIVGVYDSDSL